MTGSGAPSIFGPMSEPETGREIPIDEEDAPTAGRPADAVATEERAEAELEKVQEEARALQDRLLRLQAEFDNFKKREARERAAAWARAKADLTQKLLSALDDLQRVAALDPGETATAAVVEGVTLVERKVFEALEREGLEPIGEVGEAFDPNLHEAIAVLPAGSPDQDGTIAAVASRGYRFGQQLLRPARVQVFEYRAEGEAGGTERA